jgi:predicted dehydrogenase/nucleoside-diphosphate-sugar epimerase
MTVDDQQSAPRTLRIGLIGSGKMGLQHLKAIASAPNAVVVGIADPAADEDSLRKLIPAAAAIVADAETLLATAKPDVVHIVTPPATHTALATLALESGSHVYVEKPFTPTRAEAEKVLELAERRGLKAVAGHQCLFEEPALRAGQMLRDIGRVVHVESFSSFRMIRRTITLVDQCNDILPHAVYPLIDQLRAATGNTSDEIEITGIDASARGDVYALLRLGGCVGILEVTLSGRPIEQYQHIVGTMGALRADYIVGAAIRLVGPGTGVGVVFTPYRRAFKTLGYATRGFTRLAFGKTSYPGLHLLVRRFYESIAEGSPAPMTPRSIVDTVSVCERIGVALDKADREMENAAQQNLAAMEATLPPVDSTRGTVLVTGGTGTLGRPVATELRHSGFAVRALSRRIPPASKRVPGVEYRAADLGRPLDLALLRGVDTIVHCAAETAGGKREHERNSVVATRNVIEAAANAGVKKLIHVSSLAVLKLDAERPLDENTPIDAGNIGRGPYVWGKAESEALVSRLSTELGVEIKIVRPGPLVDFGAFAPPGRLGRELGPYFVAIGGRNSPLSVCDVWTAARVLRSYVTSFGDAPPILNMVEGPPPTRRQLVERLRHARPDLSVIWFPGWLLWLLNGPLKLAQRILLRLAQPIDVYGTFASERYRTDLALRTIERAGPSAIGR